MIFLKKYNKRCYKWLRLMILFYLLITKLKCEDLIKYLKNEIETTNLYEITNEPTTIYNLNLSYQNLEINDINISNAIDKKNDLIDNIEISNIDKNNVDKTESFQLFYSSNFSSIYTSTIINFFNSRENLFFNQSTYNYNNSLFATLESKSSLSKKDVFINIFLSFIFLAIIVLTLVGNLLVILAVVIVRKLHTEDNANNFLIVNLAVSDFLVGVLVMPFAFYVELSEDNKWNLGAIFCDLWTLSDTLLCTASILNLCAISVDRYCIILHAMVYTQRRNAKLMYFMILVVWLLSALISIPPLLGWGKPSARLEKDQLCAYSSDLKYQIYATLLAFYLPSVIMIIIYITIYRAAKKIKKRELETSGGIRNYNVIQKPSLSSCPDYQLNNKSQLEQLLGNDNSKTKLGDSYSPNQSNIYDDKNDDYNNNKYLKTNIKYRLNKNIFSNQFKSIFKGDNKNHIFVELKKIGSDFENVAIESKLYNSNTLEDSQINVIDYKNQDNGTSSVLAVVSNQPSINCCNIATNANFNKQTSHASKFGRRLTQMYHGIKRNSNSSTRRSQKATRTLGVIMGCYILCWLPFFILAILKPITLKNGHNVGEFIPKWLDSFLLWLGYFNSALNPIIYARFNREFRLPFIEIMLFRCRGINKKLRDEDRKKMNFYETNPHGHSITAPNSQNSIKKENIEANDTSRIILKNEDTSKFTKDDTKKTDFDLTNNKTDHLNDENILNKSQEDVRKSNDSLKNSPKNSTKTNPELENVIFFVISPRKKIE